MAEVPWDGETMGEIMFRGNITMKGYLKNPKATAEAFAGGWFHSGDLAVMQPDGYVKIKDRSKDIIISGGENITSLEVEDVALPPSGGAGGGGRRAAGREVGRDALRVRRAEAGRDGDRGRDRSRTAATHLARFKAPKRVIFGELPKTSTGKIQKFVLREQREVDQRDRMNTPAG